MNPTPNPLRRTRHSKMTASYTQVRYSHAENAHTLTVAGMNTGKTHQEIEIKFPEGAAFYALKGIAESTSFLNWRTRLACWLINSAKGAK